MYTKNAIAHTIQHIEHFNRVMINLLKIKWTLTEKPYDSFKTMLSEYKKAKVITISKIGSENTIYSHSLHNLQFRALHDYIHIKFNLNFNYNNEFKTWIVYSYLFEHFANKLTLDNQTIKDCLQVITLEHIGQNDYYVKHKKFIDDQLNWTIEQFNGSVYVNLDYWLNLGLLGNDEFILVQKIKNKLTSWSKRYEKQFDKLN